MRCFCVCCMVMGVVSGFSVTAAENPNPQSIKESIVTVRWKSTEHSAKALLERRLNNAIERAGTSRRAVAVFDVTPESGATEQKKDGAGEKPTPGQEHVAIAIAQNQIPGAAFFQAPAQATGILVGENILTVLPSAARNSSDLVVVDSSGAEQAAKVVAWEPATGLTVLDAKEPKAAPDSSLQIAQQSVAWGDDIRIVQHWKVGNPALVRGIVSTTPEFDENLRAVAFDVDARLTEHATGAPVLNEQLAVVGVIVAPRTEAGVPAAGIAVGSEAIEQLLAFVKAGHTGQLARPMLGTSLREHDGEVFIQQVIQDAPAAESGLQAGDRIVEIEERPITRAAQVIEEVIEKEVGDKLKLLVERDGKQKEFKIELQESKKDTDPSTKEHVRARLFFPPNFHIDPSAGLTEEQAEAMRNQIRAWGFENFPATQIITTAPAGTQSSHEATELKSQLQQVSKELGEIRELLKELKEAK